ncbi:MAG: phosphoribosylformylglycinamidine synthase I [Candidatus Dadabacteria bacterium]|nr:phosphoribosylformylglycinamidine synthase I [Candidatus Dadabacteria bacterium]
MPDFGVLLFPGSNCESDCYHAIKEVLGQPCDIVWHEETSLEGIDCIVVPGGFSYGDYLRAGAIARFSPVMNPLARLAAEGVPIIGICNGFQILVESGLLPGAFLHNSSLRFVCRWTYLRVEDTDTPFTWLLREGDVLKLPVANAQGNFVLKAGVIPRTVLRYCEPNGEYNDAANPSGSQDAIAGVANAQGNVLGMMPHPERSAESVFGSEDGRKMFESAVSWIESHKNRESALRMQEQT